MPINMSKAQDETRTVTVEYAGETADVSYHPRRLTKSFLQRMTEESDNLDRMVDMLATLISSWDVVDAAGKQLPPTPEVMSEFPLDFLNVVMRAINEATVPGEGSGAK